MSRHDPAQPKGSPLTPDSSQARFAERFRSPARRRAMTSAKGRPVALRPCDTVTRTAIGQEASNKMQLRFRGAWVGCETTPSCRGRIVTGMDDRGKHKEP